MRGETGMMVKMELKNEAMHIAVYVNLKQLKIVRGVLLYCLQR